MYNSGNTSEYIGELGASYRICLVTGLIILGAFFYFAFFDPAATGMRSYATGVTSALVCLAPAASGVMLLTSKTLAAFPEALITATLALHLLSMIWITIHVVRKIPVPHSSIILVTRVWTFASIGLLILAVVAFLFAMFHGNHRRD